MGATEMAMNCDAMLAISIRIFRSGWPVPKAEVVSMAGQCRFGSSGAWERWYVQKERKVVSDRDDRRIRNKQDGGKNSQAEEGRFQVGTVQNFLQQI
jgi:hypothetical protein